MPEMEILEGRSSAGSLKSKFFQAKLSFLSKTGNESRCVLFVVVVDFQGSFFARSLCFGVLVRTKACGRSSWAECWPCMLLDHCFKWSSASSPASCRLRVLQRCAPLAMAQICSESDAVCHKFPPARCQRHVNASHEKGIVGTTCLDVTCLSSLCDDGAFYSSG